MTALAQVTEARSNSMETAKRPDPPLKWHGGKWYLASKILSLAPPHLHYVEPFAGGLQVLLAKDPSGVSEVANDLHGELSNFWRVLQRDDLFHEFHRIVQAKPFSEAEFRESAASQGQGNAVERAVYFFITCRQSLAGRMNSFTGITKTRTRRGMNNEVSAWLSAVDGLPTVHARLRRVLILNRDALDVIRQQDGPQAWFYLDPPYLNETRAAPDVYAHEMPRSKHEELLELLCSLRGRFALSGYRSDLYDRVAKQRGWSRHDFQIPNQAAGGKKKRRMTECVWVNE